MAFDPSTIQEEKPAKAKFDPSSVKVDVPVPEAAKPEPEKKDKTFREKAGDIAAAGGYGAVAGALAPELMTGAGMLAGAFPPAAPLAPFLLAGGQLLRGGRTASALAGGLSGVTGKAAGEFVPQPEKVVAEIPGAQITRRQAAETAGEFIGPGLVKGADIAARSTPVLGAAIRTMESYVGLGEQQFKKAAERELSNLRGKVPATSIDAYRKVFDALAGAEAQERRAGLQQVSDATKRAQAILDHYNNQANRVIKYNTAEAERLKREGQAMAEGVIKDATAAIERKTGVLRKAETSGAAATERGKQAAASFGPVQTPTQVGTSIRESVMPLFEKLKQVRSQNADRLKTEAFSEALEKERTGKKVADTAAFKEAMTAIKNALTNPETKLTNVSVDSVRNQLQQVKRALDPREEVEGVIIGKPASFEALENLRRFLRDRSYGLPAEGFDAIGQQQAGRLADAVEKIQREFSPKIGKFLEQYKKDSEPLRAFKTKLGQAVVGAEEFDMSRFVTDPATIGDKFFKTETGVKQLVELLGGDVGKAEGLARAYLSDRLRKGTAKDVEKTIDDSRDWIGQFPALQQQLTNIAREMGIAERVAGKRGELAKALRTDIASLPIGEAKTTAAEMAAKAQKESEQRVQRGLTQAERLRQQGQKLAKGTEAPVVEGVLTGADPVAQIEGFITKGETEKLKKIAPVLRSSPELKQAFNQALDITLSRMEPGKVTDNFERTIKPALLNTGLLTPERAAQISQRLRTVQMTLEPSAAAQTARWIIRTAVTGEVGTGLSD